MSQARVLTLNVSPNGPLTSLEEARDEIRRIKPPDGFPEGGVLVEIDGGSYERKGPFVLEKQDSGTEVAPVVYRDKSGEFVRLAGGPVVDEFEPVADPDILDRLVPEARTHVLQANLGNLGTSDFGSASGGGLELFYDDEPMTVARWPNLNSSKDGKLWARSAWNHRFHRTLGARSYTPPSVSRHVGLPSAFMSWFSCRSCVSGCGVLSNQG